MSVVIADTSPIHYLILIERVSLLPSLFEQIVIPASVRNELSDPNAPDSLRQWIALSHEWLTVMSDPILTSEDRVLFDLDAGERSAIQLALDIKADLILMDDRAGVLAAKQKGLLVTGTLGLLDLAAERGLVNFAEVIERLQTTNFRYPQALIERLLKLHSGQSLE